MYKLKSNNGQVNALLRAGKDLVKTKLDEKVAQSVINKGHILESDVAGYPIKVGDKWYFEGEQIVEEEEKADFRRPFKKYNKED